ncbi:hypothetical protein M9Y10_009436 [Tritrichomonas musculus]|uniref:FERM domain-containing protein n=1 Tax=Tritrichomonas musculus TaxID=1915356 RepID=A0ABR2INA9_9EUKA
MERVALKTATANYFDENNEKKRKKPFLYKRTDLGRQILEEAKKNLQITDTKKYKILLKMEKGVYNFVDLDKPLNSMRIIDNTSLIVVKEEEAIKIVLNESFSRTILVDVTLLIHDIMKPISERLHYKCQYNQYSIWAYDKSRKLVPLNSNLSIAEQTQDYRSLIFRRRYYLVFAPDFAEFEEARHIYRDMKQQYLEGLTYAELDQAVKLAYFMMYADFETQEDTEEYVQKISTDSDFKFKSLIPQNHGKFHSDKFKKKFLSTFKANPPLGQFQAMDKFIRESRTLKNFGDERYKGILANQADGIKCHLYVGPHGIQIMDQSESKELEKIHILKIKSFKQKKRMINIKFKDDKNNDKSVSLSLSKVDFITTMLNDSISFIQSYYNSELENQMKRSIGVSDEIQLASGQYSTLVEAEEAIELFKTEMFKLDDILYTDFGLTLINDSEEVKIDDYTKLNEMEELKEFSTKLNDILLKNLPNVSLQYIIGKSTKKRLEAFLAEIKEMRGSSHQIKYKEILFILSATIHYLKSIEVSFPDFKLGPLLKGPLSYLNSLINASNARFEKRKTQDISDLVSVFVEEFNKIIVEFPNIEKQVEKVISSFPQLNQANETTISKILPKGQITVILLLDSINNFIELTFSKKNEMFIGDISSYQKVLSNAYDYYPKIYQFADDLANKRLTEKSDINDRFNNILSIFDSIDPFIVEVTKSKKLNDNVKNEFKSSFSQIVRLFDILKTCSIGQGEFNESKLFTGSHSKLSQTINCLPDLKKTLKSLTSEKLDSSIKEKVTHLTEYIDKNEEQLKSFYQQLEKNPSDAVTRYKASQIVQQINTDVHAISESVSKTNSDLNPFSKIIESSLRSISPENCSLRRVDVCIKSFMEIIDAINEKQINDSWVEPLKTQLNEMRDLYQKLVNSPTDGSVLARLHNYMIILLQYAKNIQENLILSNHRTVPLIIEFSIPNILRAIEDPLITDEYERCEHLIAFSQMQFDLRQLINFCLTLVSRPNISSQKSIVDELTKNLNVLQTIYIEYSSRRSDLLSNPYTYPLILPILNMLNHVKMTEANMIDVVRKIDDINMNYALKKCLCQSMVSALSFIDIANKMKLRPYRKLFTVQEITDYRLNIINLVAFIKECALNEKGNNLKLLEKESKQYMKFMVFIQKELKQPTHNFEFIVMDINKFLNGIYARCNFPSFTSKRDGVQKVDLLQKQNDKIIMGQKPTPTLLEKLINEMIDNMNSFNNKIIPKKGSFSSNIQEIVTTWGNEFKALIPKVKPFLSNDKKNQIDFEQIRVIRKILLDHFRKCPKLRTNVCSKDIDNDSLNQMLNTYLSFDDCVNLTRQFPEMCTIQLKFETLEESLATEIQELGEVILEQFQTMSTIFTNQLIPHRLVQKSSRLVEFTTQLSLFFTNNSSLLNDHKNNIEQFIEQFCRDTQLTLPVINKNVQLLSPILSTDSLLVSCDALQYNVSKVISQFDKHQFTNQTASEFIKDIVPNMLSIRDQYKELSKNQLISTDKEFITYLNEASNLISLMEKELVNIKPSQLQQHCDKIYDYLSENIPINENQLDESDLYNQSVTMYNHLMNYTSLKQKRIYITSPLIVKQQIIP